MWIFGHDLTTLVAREKLEKLAKARSLHLQTNEHPGAAWAHWVLPTAAHVEKDGTFVNYHGRVQRVGRAFPPLADSREDWRLLLEISRQLDQPLPWRNPQEIFQGLAQAVPYFGGLSYETIGSQGTLLPLPGSTITSRNIARARRPTAGGACCWDGLVMMAS